MKINGEVYGWTNVTANIPDMPITPQEITYGDGLDSELVYGVGAMPRGYSNGNYEPTLKLVFLREDFDELLEYCKKQGKSLYKMVIDKLTVAYAKENENIKIDEITKIKFKKVDDKAAQGDKALKVDVECLVYGMIVRNGVKPL